MCTYSRYFFTELTRGVWLWPPVDVSILTIRRIVHIPYTAHITNEEVRHRTGQSPVTSVIAKGRHRLFGHLARADPPQDHSRILRAAISRPPADWRRRAGRPRRTWLRTIKLDLHSALVSTRRGCMRRIVQSGVSLRRRLLTDGRATRWWWDVLPVIQYIDSVKPLKEWVNVLCNFVYLLVSLFTCTIFH